MYGFKDKAEAIRNAAQLSDRYPDMKFEVHAHSWTPTGEPLTWGVQRFIQYTGTMPWKLDGFVWFSQGVK